jgi:hypothetical protein
LGHWEFPVVKGKDGEYQTTLHFVADVSYEVCLKVREDVEIKEACLEIEVLPETSYYGRRLYKEVWINKPLKKGEKFVVIYLSGDDKEIVKFSFKGFPASLFEENNFILERRNRDSVLGLQMPVITAAWHIDNLPPNPKSERIRRALSDKVQNIVERAKKEKEPARIRGELREKVDGSCEYQFSLNGYGEYYYEKSYHIIRKLKV